MFDEFQNQIDCIKEYKANHESTFDHITTEMGKAFQQQHASINKQNEGVQKAKTATDQLMKDQNKNQDKVNEMSQDLEELLTWKKEMTNQQFEENDKYIKIEADDEDDDEVTKDNECIKMETNYEMNDVDDIEEELNQKTNTTAAIQNENLRIEWYKFSARFIPEKYKLQYVHANAESRNKKRSQI